VCGTVVFPIAVETKGSPIKLNCRVLGSVATMAGVLFV
jgi:hypothetical protein